MIMAYDCSHSAVKTRYLMIYCEHVIQLVKGGNTQKVYNCITMFFDDSLIIISFASCTTRDIFDLSKNILNTF